MFEAIINFFKKFSKSEEEAKSKDTAKERLHLVLMQDRANISADFLDMMKQEIIEVIKKYIEIDEKEIDVKLTNKTNEDGSVGAPALYANIPISKIKNENKENIENNAEKNNIENNKIEKDNIEKNKTENNNIENNNIEKNNKENNDIEKNKTENNKTEKNNTEKNNIEKSNKLKESNKKEQNNNFNNHKNRNIKKDIYKNKNKSSKNKR